MDKYEVELVDGKFELKHHGKPHWLPGKRGDYATSQDNKKKNDVNSAGAGKPPWTGKLSKRGIFSTSRSSSSDRGGSPSGTKVRFTSKAHQVASYVEPNMGRMNLSFREHMAVQTFVDKAKESYSGRGYGDTSVVMTDGEILSLNRALTAINREFG